MHDGAREGWCGAPEVLVIQKIDGVPSARDENIKNVHYMTSVRDDYSCLNHGAAYSRVSRVN